MPAAAAWTGRAAARVDPNRTWRATLVGLGWRRGDAWSGGNAMTTTGETADPHEGIVARPARKSENRRRGAQEIPSPHVTLVK